ncbi:selenocysteine-specific translation elongation factor [Haloechinothrix salitolerans]|uniref:Selenocysteine-specific elongation factor n=1 Tax=Haloechinothrix salitolerans TaxID=926830 RepID=A0ABW2BV35_9PSEU
MRVIATAGHVDHGKSTLLRRLTGMEPDRWEEERRRGLTIDLGFAWTELDRDTLAFVDVPGHERFVPNMLAGVGPVPAALFVVAADEGWMPQSEEHLAALHALGVRHGLLAISKSDRADPDHAAQQARARIARSSLGDVPWVAVSGTTGDGLPELRTALATLARSLPSPDTDADVRLWVDRAFTVRGAGTVVTGTLAAGTLRTGDALALPSGERVRVRSLQSLGHDVTCAAAVARVALNLRGVEPGTIRRGDALLRPDAWLTTSVLDVRLRRDSEDASARGDGQAGTTSDRDGRGIPDNLRARHLMLHAGSAAVPARVRPLGPDTARLTLDRLLPLRTGDVCLLRDPGEHRIHAGVDVLDVDPPALGRRGSARRRAAELNSNDPGELAGHYLRRHGFVRAGHLRMRGLPDAGVEIGDWRADPDRWAELPKQARERVRAWRAANPLAAGMPSGELRRELGLPDGSLLDHVLVAAELTQADGLVRERAADTGLPEHVDLAVRTLETQLAEAPFRAPDADKLRALGLGHRELAAAVRAGRLSRIAEGVVLGPDAVAEAARALADMPQPFTVSQVRKALTTTRRVAVPLLELLDAEGVTRLRPDGTRVHRADGR